MNMRFLRVYIMGGLNGYGNGRDILHFDIVEYD